MVPVDQLAGPAVATVVAANEQSQGQGPSEFCRKRRLPNSRIVGEECYATANAAEDELNAYYIQSEIREVRRLEDLDTMRTIQDRVLSGAFGTTPSNPAGGN